MSLETYVTEPRRIEIGGKTVTIAPLKVRQIPAFARHVGPAATELFAGNLAGALALHGEGLIAAVAVATGEEAGWIGDLDADEFLRLVGEVVEVNADFFAHRVSPALSQTVARLTQALTPGATPSPSSSPADSPGATAST